MEVAHTLAAEAAVLADHTLLVPLQIRTGLAAGHSPEAVDHGVVVAEAAAGRTRRELVGMPGLEGIVPEAVGRKALRIAEAESRALWLGHECLRTKYWAV